MIGTINGEAKAQPEAALKKGLGDGAPIILTDSGREKVIAFKATFEDRGFNELLELSRVTGEKDILCLAGDKYFVTPKVYEKLTTPYVVLKGWDEESTKEVKSYLEKLKRGEMGALKVPDDLDSEGLKKWMLEQGKKIKDDAVHPDEQKMVELVGKIRDQGIKKAKLNVINRPEHVGWAPEDLVWSEKDTRLIEETLAGRGPKVTEAQKKLAQEYNTNPNILALFEIPRVKELIGLIGEHARDEDINELHDLEDPFFEKIKEQFERGEISHMFIRPLEDMCDMLYGKKNYEFKVE